jgi:hypothetical protein
MATAKNRPKRTPIGTRSVLKSEENKGFKRRFVNDEPGRIQEFLDAGYKVVDVKTQMGDDNVGQASQVGSVAQKPVGGGMNAVLMEIPEDYYAEDQAAKETRIKELEEGMLNDQNGQTPNSNNLYGEGVKIKPNRPTVQTE